MKLSFKTEGFEILKCLKIGKHDIFLCLHLVTWAPHETWA